MRVQTQTVRAWTTVLRAERGFTFIEIMVLVAILAILAALALFVAARAGLREDVTWGAKLKPLQLLFPAKERKS